MTEMKQKKLTLSILILAFAAILLAALANILNMDFEDASSSSSNVLGCASEYEDVTGNIVQNPSFEDGLTGWTSGGGTISAVSTVKNSGCQSLLVSGRSQTYHGPGQDLDISNFNVGDVFEIYGFVRAASGTPKMKITLKRTDSSTSYNGIASATVNSSGWTEIRGTYIHSESGTLSGMRVYVESADTSTTDFYLDDLVVAKVSGSSGDWVADANARIEEIRKRDVQVKVQNNSGTAISGATVQITQTKSEFAFGTAINVNRIQDWTNGTPSTLNTYEQFVVDNFEWTVSESRHKWPAFEYSRDNVTYTNADKLVNFSKKNDLRMRGHALTWGVTYTDFEPPWVHVLADNTSTTAKNNGGSELEEEVMEHIEDVVPRYADYIEHWDVNNEMTHGNIYGIPMTARMHQLVKQLDSDVLATINDYHVISPRSYSGGDRLEDYIQLVKDVRAAGGQVDLLGVQGHFESDVMINASDVYYRFERLTQELGNTPIWVTEFDQNYQNKENAADSLENLYRAAFSHRNVGGVLMWGFWDGQHWRDDAAIVEQDWSLNAAGQRYLDLRDEWSTEASASTNSSGIANFRGFHGEYDVRVTLPGGQVVNGEFTLSSESDQALVVTINSDGQQSTSSSATSSATTSSTSSQQNLSSNPGTRFNGGVSLPGKLEIENFNVGANGVAYYDKSSGNESASGSTIYRDTDVDLKEGSVSGNYVIGFFEEGEWLHYTVDADIAASYQIQVNAGTIYAGRQLQIYVGDELEATIDVPQVSDWDIYELSTPVSINLAAGENVVRVQMSGGNYADVDYIDFSLDDQSVSSCAPDYTGDGQVDAADLSVFAVNYLQNDIDCGLDLSGGDCRLDEADFTVFSSAYKVAGYCD